MILEKAIENEAQMVEVFINMLINCDDEEQFNQMAEAAQYHEFIGKKLKELLSYRKAFDKIMYRIDLDKAYIDEHFPNRQKSEECQEELVRIKRIIKEYLSEVANDNQ